MPEQHADAVGHPLVLLTWAAVLVVFVALDTATTHVGLSWGAIEANRLVADGVESHGLWFTLPMKSIVSVGALVAYRAIPRPHRVGIPAGLGLVGSLVVTRNLLVLVVIA